jgi:hypothetical protein
VAGQWFSAGNLVSPINKTDRHNVTEILLKVALNTGLAKKWEILLFPRTAGNTGK